jgi:hypothetical protein
MKCKKCEFNLSCLAARLDYHDGKHANVVLLCPNCNRLSVGIKINPGRNLEDAVPPQNTLTIFDCELRHYSSEVCKTWEIAVENGKANPGSSYPVPDIGPGLQGKLHMGLCYDCLERPPLNKEELLVKYPDDDKEETIAPHFDPGEFNG